MFLTRFPDLNWLKVQTGQIKKSVSEWKNDTGIIRWPSVILNVKSENIERPDIKGPLSFFTNITGESIAEAPGHTCKIDNTRFFLTNQQENYSLYYPQKQQTETFNIHFSEDLCDQVLGSYTGKVENSDELISPHNSIAFYTKSYRRTPTINKIISSLYEKQCKGPVSKLFEEEKLSELIVELLKEHTEIRKQIAKIPTIKAATREQLFHRISVAIDYMHSFSENDISLDELAKVSCISKFHFLRLFKILYGKTPYQHLTDIRVEKAGRLLRATNLQIADIGAITGFEDSSTFSRSFKNKTGYYPSQYRLL